MAVVEQSGVMTYVDGEGNKTLLYPVTKKENVEGLEDLGEQVQADWNQNDSSQPSFIQNKPTLVELSENLETSGKAADSKIAGDAVWQAAHAGVATNADAVTCNMSKFYDAYIKGELVGDMFCHVSDKVPTMEDIQNGFSIVVGESLEAEFGVSGIGGAQAIEVMPYSVLPNIYSAVVTDMGGIILVREAVVVPEDNITIEGLTFPKKGVYLPSHVLSFSINGFSFNDSGSLDELVEEITEYSDTLTWDGDTAGRSVVDVDEHSSMVHVSDAIPPMDALVNFTETIRYDIGEEVEITDQDIRQQGDIILVNESLAIVPYAGVTYDGVSFPKAGVYFLYYGNSYVSSFRIPGFNFGGKVKKQIKVDALPESHQFGETVIESTIFGSATADGSTLSWDGNIEGLRLIAPPNPPTGVGGWFLITKDVGFLGIHNTISFIKNDGTEYTDQIIPVSDTDNKLYTTELLDMDAVFAINDYTISGITFEKGVYMGATVADGVATPYVKSISIDGYTWNVSKGKSEIKTIDTKYLPEHLQFGKTEDGGSLYGSVSIEDGSLVWDGDTSGLVNPSNGNQYLITDDISFIDSLSNGWTAEIINSSGEKEIVTGSGYVEFGGENILAVTANSTFIDWFMLIIMLEDNLTVEEITFPKKGVYAPKVEGDFYNGYLAKFTINNYEFKDSSVKRLDEMYMPLLTSPNGTQFKLSVADDGTLTATPV